MGAEARTTLRLGAREHAVTALLESDALVVRGEHRMRIPLGPGTLVTVHGDSLRLEHAGQVADLVLGARVAARWCERIRNPRTLADKLGVRSGMCVSLLGVAHAELPEQLSARGATVERDTVSPGAPLVLLRAAVPETLDILPRLAATIARDGAIWVVHPRGVPAVADVVIFAAGRAAGLVATKVLRFDETDTAERLVIPVAAR